MHQDSHLNSCHVQVFLQQNKIYFIEKEMGQTRVKAGHIELVQGSKYTKNVKRMRWICARDKRRSNRTKSIFSFWDIRVFAVFYYFCVHCLFSSQENNSKQSVAHKLKRINFPLEIRLNWQNLQ